MELMMIYGSGLLIRIAAIPGMHVSPMKLSDAWLSRKCDYRKDTYTQTPDKVIPMCPYALQVTQKPCHTDHDLSLDKQSIWHAHVNIEIVSRDIKVSDLNWLLQ